MVVASSFILEIWPALYTVLVSLSRILPGLMSVGEDAEARAQR